MSLLPRLSPAPLLAHLREQRAHLTGLSARLNGASYESVLARGFALVRDTGGHPVTSAASVRPKASLVIRFADGEAAVTAAGKDSTRQGALPL
jgi:exodeoxyribonuclease VII large subunit